MMEGNDHKGRERHSLVIAHQAPLVNGGEKRCQARAGGAPTYALEIDHSSLACPYEAQGRSPGRSRLPVAGAEAIGLSPVVSQTSLPPAHGPNLGSSTQRL